MKDISNEKKIEMFPELLSARFYAFNRCDYEEVSDIYRILEDYGFNDEEIYFLLDNIIEDVTGFYIKDCSAGCFRYGVPMTDGSTLFIESTSDGDMWHGYIEDENEEVVFDSYVEMFDWERESDEDMNTSRLIDVFELAEPNDMGYCWDDIEGIL